MAVLDQSIMHQLSRQCAWVAMPYVLGQDQGMITMPLSLYVQLSSSVVRHTPTQRRCRFDAVMIIIIVTTSRLDAV